ncbi:stabilin-2-like [Dreissena polymorpha]|uniref:stabilin-2-like n=1 Tax=Dreissena polymorpha TaxID=45954 RepID=UPI002263D471|nr:stabilin-2-like [Dreissena polymorpha]
MTQIQDLGTACTVTADCDTTTNPAAVCSTSGTKICTCATGYTKQGTACKADLGTACTATADCDTTAIQHAVCDVLATTKVCKIKSTGDCTVNTDKCVSGAACTANACACSAKYKEDTNKLCATVLGSTCTATADCTTTVANSDCTGTGTKTCTCNFGFTKQGADCSDIWKACNTTADCDTTTTPTAVCDVLATAKDCKIKSTGSCAGNTDKCVSGAACTNDVCVCSTKYKENTDKLCATVLGSTCTATADCTATVANSDCTGTGSKTCTCNTGFTKQGADCSGATGVAACLAMILACIFTTIV